MSRENNKWWYGVTPGGTLLIDTKAKSKEKCIKNLLDQSSHMPYKDWEERKKYGYTVEQMDIDL